MAICQAVEHANPRGLSDGGGDPRNREIGICIHDVIVIETLSPNKGTERRAASQLFKLSHHRNSFGTNALCRGWETIDTPDTSGGVPRKVRYRFFQAWEKQDGGWRMTGFICNRDVPPRMLGE